MYSLMGMRTVNRLIDYNNLVYTFYIVLISYLMMHNALWLKLYVFFIINKIWSILFHSALILGYVSYVCVDKNTNLKRDTLFCYDLELPSTFIPTPMDGEVESFELRDLEWVLEKVVQGGSEGYKPNCNLVVIDFLIRWSTALILNAHNGFSFWFFDFIFDSREISFLSSQKHFFTITMRVRIE